MKNRTRNGMCLALVVMLGIVSTKGLPSDAYELPVPPDSALESSAGHLQQHPVVIPQAGNIPTAFRRLLEAGSLLPATPTELSDRTSGAPQDILEFVRTNFDYDPYVGSLRGATGTLLSGGGNDIDLMLLLKESIAAAHPDMPVRFAHRPEGSGHRKARAAIQPSFTVEQIAQIAGLAESEVEANLEDSPEVVAEMTTLNTLIAKEAQFLSNHLADRIVPPTAIAGEDHWWLQVRQGNRWLDLDPTPGSGSSPAVAGHTTELPDSLYHRVQVELELERVEGNQAEREMIFRRVLRTSDVAGKVMSLVVAPEAFDPNKLAEVLANANMFQAVFQLDDDAELSRVFDLEGDLYQSQGGGFSKAVESLGMDITSILSRRAPPQPSQLTAVILRITFSGPGRPTRSHERWIVDRLDRAALAAGQVVIAPEGGDLVPLRAALVRSYHLYLILGPENESSIARAMAELVLDADLSQALKAMVERQETSDPTQLRIVDRFARLSLANMTFVAQSLGAASEPGALQYSQPGLLLLRESLRSTQSGTKAERAVDVVSGGAVGKSLAAAVRYGVALSYAERDVLGPEPGAQAAVELLAKAREAGDSFSVVESSPAVESLRWPAGARARLAGQIEDGFVALVPERPSNVDQLAWWRVDPNDATPIATAAGGEGQAIIEGTMVLREISIPQVQRTLTYVACLNASVLGGASLNQAGGQCLCRYLGGQVAGAVSSAARSRAVGNVAQAAGLGPMVKFMLGAGSGYLQQAAGLSPGRPVRAVCEAIMP